MTRLLALLSCPLRVAPSDLVLVLGEADQCLACVLHHVSMAAPPLLEVGGEEMVRFVDLCLDGLD